MERRTILLPRPRGFCAGVIRAIDIVTLALQQLGRPVYVRKEIVHNRFVVDQLAAEGAVFVDSLDEVPDGAVTIFSAHGVSPEVREEARIRNLRIIDATCPLVTKVHLEVIRYARENGILTAVRGSAGGSLVNYACLLYTSPSPRDGLLSRMPSSA